MQIITALRIYNRQVFFNESSSWLFIVAIRYPYFVYIRKCHVIYTLDLVKSNL